MATILNTAHWIQEQLQQAFDPSFLSIKDDSYKHIGHEGAREGGGHYTVEIWSRCFVNKPLIDCHRMIYEILDSAIPHKIHALKIKLKKPI